MDRMKKELVDEATEMTNEKEMYDEVKGKSFCMKGYAYMESVKSYR